MTNILKQVKQRLRKGLLLKPVIESADTAGKAPRRKEWFAIRNSVGKKLFATIFISILACVLLMGLISYQISKSVLRKRYLHRRSKQ